MIIWLAVATPNVPRTRFLCPIKVAGANNMDTKGAGGVVKDATGGVARSVIDDIAE